jgi:hypothetical protein
MGIFRGFEDWNKQLKNMREGGSDTRAFFTRRLRASEYLVPIQPEGKGLSLLATQHGERFLPAFTSEVEFGKWKQAHGGAAVLTFEALHNTVVDDTKLAGIVINPFGASLILQAETLSEMEGAVTGMTHARTEHKGKTFFKAAKYSPALARAFVAALKDSGMDVSEAYILLARREEDAQSHLLFLIDFKGDRKQLFPAVAKAVRPYMKPGANFELLQAGPATLAAAGEQARPVFRK